MRNLRHMRVILALILVGLLLITGCAKPTPQPASSPSPSAVPTIMGTTRATLLSTSTPAVTFRKAKGTYISGTSAGDAETLNWILAADSTSLSYAGATLDSLASYDNNYNVLLRHLAKPIQVSDDGLVYTITIRDDLKWSDGTKVTADDYVYTLRNLMFSDWLNYNYKDTWQETVDGKTVFVDPEVVNDTTFSITKKTADPEFADNALYSLTPYPKHIAQKYEGNIKAFTEAPEFNNLTYTGNLGAYKFQEWVRNDKYVTVRNPDFYLGQQDGSPYFEQDIDKLFGTAAARQAALEAGDIVSTGIDPSQVAKFKKLNDIEVYTVPTTGYSMMAFNLRKNGWEGLKDKRVRQAISMSISKDILVQSILLGFGEPAFSFLPRPSPWYTEEGVSKYGVEPLYNKEKAKQLLMEAGYGTKKADGSINVTGKDGKPLKLTVLTNSGEKTRESMVFLVKQELSDLGIDVDMKFVPWETELRQYLMNKVPGSTDEPRFNNGSDAVSDQPWDMIIIGLSSNPIAPSGQSVFLTTKGGLNFGGYSSPQVDALFDRARSKEAIDPKARQQIYKQLSQLVSDDLPWNFLTFHAATIGIQKKVKGIEPGINMGYNSHLWYFEP